MLLYKKGKKLFKKKKKLSKESFASTTDIYNRYKYNSKITDKHYIDPLEYEYNRTMVSCTNCIFSYGLEKCMLFKEKGYTDSEINHIIRKVSFDTNYCDYFLIENFSEGNNEDDIARDACNEISRKVY